MVSLMHPARAIMVMVTLLVTAPKATAACTPWPSDGFGRDATCFLATAAHAGYTPAQASRVQLELDRLAGPLITGRLSPATVTAQGQAFCRAQGQSLRTLWTKSPTAHAAWEDDFRQKLEQRLRAQVSAHRVPSFLFGCGLSSAEATALLSATPWPGQLAPQTTWNQMQPARPPVFIEPPSSSTIQRLRSMVHATGLRWLRIDADQAIGTDQVEYVSSVLWSNDQGLRKLSGLNEPMLGLGGHVGLDLRRSPVSGLEGNSIADREGVIIQADPHTLGHEWFHALDFLLSPSGTRPSSDTAGSPLAVLLATLSSAHHGAALSAVLRAETRARILTELTDNGMAASAAQALLDAPKAVSSLQWTAAGATPRDAVLLVALVEHARAHPNADESWVRLRQIVAACLPVPASSATAALDQATAAYLSSPTELLASDGAAVLYQLRHDTASIQAAHPLEMPTATQAQLDTAAWQAFFKSSRAAVVEVLAPSH